MRLYRTLCSTDWKGRPNHNLKLVAEGDRAELLVAQDKDIREWMAGDIAGDEECLKNEAEEEIPDGWYLARVVELLEGDQNLAAMWLIKNQRWEMRVSRIDLKDSHREFAEVVDDNRQTIVYHFEDF